MSEPRTALDLGSGGVVRTPEGYVGYGVDIVDVGLPHVRVADLALEPIPFGDNAFDLVTAYDFMEHIPMSIYVFHQGKTVKRNCMIDLFNEIYRILKPNGEFYMQSPCYPSNASFQDPTHVSFWTTETIHYFSGDYFGFHDHYGHKSRFEKLQNEVVGSHIHIRLRARKDIPEEHPYLLHY